MHRALFVLAVLVLMMIGLTGCGSTSEPSEPASPQVQAFFDAFLAQKYDALPKVMDDLATAYGRDPHDVRNTLIYAHSNLWRVSEWARNPSQDPAQIPAYVGAASRYFNESYALNPSDPRILGWIGAVGMGIGRSTGDQALIAKGRQSIDEGVKQWPEFNLTVRAMVDDRLPPGDPGFNGAVETLWENYDVCVGEKVDRNGPKVSKYLVLMTTTGPKRACWDPPAAPHNLEGYLFFFGDMLVKQGNVEVAKNIYASTRELPQYATWPLKNELEARISDADKRAALYKDSDPSNDPEIVVDGPASCAVCHAAQ